MKLKYTIFIVITFFISSNSMADKMIIDDMKNQSGVPDEEFCESGNACLLYTSPSPRDGW